MIARLTSKKLWQALAGCGAISLLLSWAASGFRSLDQLPAFFLVILLGAGFLWLGWVSLRREPRPAWLGGWLVLAALLRLGLGVFWSIALPAWGYGSDVELAGYVMQDAYARDRSAWELAISSQPLTSAFTENQPGDQYGGLLFLSAGLYRVLGGGTHQPLMMVVLAASFSALAILYTWAFTHRLAGSRAAMLAAGGLALYPEAVLLGSSQMREAFTLTLAIFALYALHRYLADLAPIYLVPVLISLLVCVAISPPTAGLILILLAASALAQSHLHISRQIRLWLLLGGLALLAGLVLWLVWSQLAPQSVVNPAQTITWWLRKAAEFQAYQTRQASGWIQRIFRDTPAALHMPLLVIYGVAQPFLPAALVAGGAPIWQGIAIWRAMGWAVLLVLLVYATWTWLRNTGQKRLVGILLLVVWLVILVAALRSGGDLWDNPRYRVVLAGVQLSLAAWGVVEGQTRRDLWLKRFLIGGILILAWFIPWYLRRYLGLVWPVVDPFKTLGLGLASACLYFLWDWARLQPTGGQGDTSTPGTSHPPSGEQQNNLMSQG